MSETVHILVYLDSIKLIVHIADAPGHGIEYVGGHDNYPEEDGSESHFKKLFLNIFIYSMLLLF